MLYKAIKNKKVKVKSPDNVEKDETTKTSNTCNSKCQAVPSMILLQQFQIYQRSTFCKRLMLGTAQHFELRVFYYIFSLCSEHMHPHALPFVPWRGFPSVHCSRTIDLRQSGSQIYLRVSSKTPGHCPDFLLSALNDNLSFYNQSSILQPL